MEEIISLPPMDFFNNDYHLVLDFIESLGNPKYTIAGNVILDFNLNITSLGNLVEVEGSLDLRDVNVKSLPDTLKKVGGNLNLANTIIEHLPDNLYVGNDLDLFSCMNLKKLPNNLHVGNTIDISYTNIDTVPDKLYVYNVFDVYKSKLSIEYSRQQIRRMVIKKGGEIVGSVFE